MIKQFLSWLLSLFVQSEKLARSGRTEESPRAGNDSSCITCLDIDNCEILDALEASGGVALAEFSCSEYKANRRFLIERTDLK